MSALSGILDAMNQTQFSIREVAIFTNEETTQLGKLHQLVVELDARLEKNDALAEMLEDAPVIESTIEKTPPVATSPIATTPSESKQARNPTTKDQEVSCPVCGMVCKNGAGLSAHRRFAHVAPTGSTPVTTESGPLEAEIANDDDDPEPLTVPMLPERKGSYADRVRANRF